MSTSGIVIIQDGDGIAAKVIAQCNGFNAAALAARIESFQPESLSTIATLALEEHFGCEDCLVVITPARAIHYGPDDLPQRYWDTYWQPDINPAASTDHAYGFAYRAQATLDHTIKEVQS